jgi:hypothetical protein
VDGLLQDKNHDEILFMTQGRLGLLVWNFSDPAVPWLMSNTSIFGDCDDVTRRDENHVVLGCGTSGILVYNIQNLSSPYFVSHAPTLGQGGIEGVRVSNNG